MRTFALGLIPLVGCAASPCPPSQAPAPSEPPPTTAAALVEVLPSEQGRPSPVTVGAESFRTEEVLSLASAAVRSTVGADHVRVTEQDDGIRIEVEGRGEQGALARCEAVVRAAIRAADAGEDLAWLRDERDGAERRLEELERSLQEVPVASGAPPDPDAFVAWAKEADNQLRIAEGLPVALLERSEGGALRSIQRLVADLMQRRDALLGSGKGERHPDVVRATRHQSLAEQWLARQKRQEAEALRLVVETWEAEDKRGVPTTLAWQRAWVRATLRYVEQQAEPDAAGFLAPLPLRLLANEAAHVGLEDALQSSRYGDNHPRRLANRARAQAVRAAFDRERAFQVQRLSKRLRSLEKSRKAASPEARLDPREHELRKQRDELAGIIVELDRRRRKAEQSPPKLRVREVCSVDTRP